MRGTIMYGPGDVRYEEMPEPTILKSTDAIIKLSATCVCGSDLWPFRGANEITAPMHMGHEYCGLRRPTRSRPTPTTSISSPT